MSANELEEFIKIIEYAEQSSCRSSTLDIFAPKVLDEKMDVVTLPMVPKLWDPSTESEFLGSSLECSSAPQSGLLLNGSRGTVLETVRSSKPSNSDSFESRPNLYAKLEQHNKFGRRVARELSPSILSNPLGSSSRSKTLSSVHSHKTSNLEHRPIKSSDTKNQRSQPVDDDANNFRSLSPESEPRVPPPNPVPKLVSNKEEGILGKVRSDNLGILSKNKGGGLLKGKKLKQREELKVEKVSLNSYPKSLKLIGIDIQSQATETTPIKQDKSASVVKPRSSSNITRLTKRTQSLSDLRQIISSTPNLSKEKFAEIKRPLNCAVFEEWYFKKLYETRLKCKKPNNMDEGHLSNDKSLEEYAKWLDRKKAEMRARSKKTEVVHLVDDDGKRAEKARQAESSWRSKKALEEKKKVLELKKKTEVEEELEKNRRIEKEEANKKQFLAWKRFKHNQELERRKLANEKLRQKQQAELIKAEERVKAAELSFKAWLQKKVSQASMKTKLNLRRTASASKLDVNGNESANYEAYDKWLAEIEQKDEEYWRYQNNFLKVWKPPWYPGGVSSTYY